MISRSTIDKVFENARLEEVIGEYVTLKKSGANFKGLSPFTQERTPSFMVSPTKQIWKDFSSGKGGNVIAFLMEHEHFTYPEAIRYLAKKYNIEIEESEITPEEKQIKDDKESMFLVAQYASSFFEKNLWETEAGKSIGLTYFKERGFLDETLKKFALGFSPDSYNALTKQALKEGYQLEFLKKTGLVIVNEDRKVDRFRGRVVFPIRSMSGRVQGFGGRKLSQNTKTAKYLNSPESEIYNKSKALYGIFESKQAIAKNDVCYLVEGYTDVIQMHQSGIANVVSSSGTALTVDQIRLINRFTSNIVVLFDGDAAGLRASVRGIDLILEQGMNVKVCTFPEGEDPDSFAKSHTKDEISIFLQEESKDFIEFKASLLKEDGKNDPIRKAETIREIIESIFRIPDVIKQEIYIQNCAKIMHISEQALFSALAQVNQKNKQKGTKKLIPNESFALIKKTTDTAVKINHAFELERQIISILLTYGNEELNFEELVTRPNKQGELVEVKEKITAKVYEKIFLDLQQDEIELSHETFKKIFYKLIEFYQIEQDDFNLEKIIQTDDLVQNEIITDLIMKEEQHQLHDWKKRNVFVKTKGSEVVQLVSETILSMRRYLIDQKIVELKIDTKQQEENKETLIEIKRYQRLKNIISNKLDRVL